MNRITTWTALLVGVFIACVISLSSLSSYGQENALKHVEKNILVLNSYTPDNVWTRAEEQGFRHGIDESHANVAYYYEYMATKKFTGEAYFEVFKDMLKTKYGKLPIDCVLTTDDDATLFMVKYRKIIFGKDIPVIFCGVNSQYVYPPGVWGLQEKTSIVKLIEMIRELHGKDKKITVFTDLTSSSTSTIKALYDQTTVTFRKNLNVIRDDNVQRVRSKLAACHDEVLIFLLFNRDSTGKAYTYLEGYELFKDIIKVPTYSTWDFYLGSGIVGGIFTSPIEQGEKAAKLALALLDANGKPEEKAMEALSARLNVLENKTGFDHNVLTAWGITESKLPKDALIINKPVSYFEKNKELFLISFGIIAFLVAVILYMIRIIHLKNRYQNELSMSHQELENVNSHLESMVEEKVGELEKSYKRLNETEIKLMQKEKVESMLNLSLQTAHELNTPIGNSITMVSFIKSETENAVREIKAMPKDEEASNCCKRFDEYIETLLESVEIIDKSLIRVADYSKSIKDRLASVGELDGFSKDHATNLEALVKRSWQDLKGLSQKSEIEFQCNGPMIWLTDREAHVIGKVMKTLFENSLRHGFGETLANLHPNINVEWSYDGSWLKIICEDNGIGISPERLRHLFTPMYKSDLSKGDASLGLYSARCLIESELTGSLEYSDSSEKGTRFEISLKSDGEKDI